MELAPKGSLRKVLACDHLSRGMQHRIASQVCKAKVFPNYSGTMLIFPIPGIKSSHVLVISIGSNQCS